MKILFLGHTFPLARSMLRELLPNDEIIDGEPEQAIAGKIQVDVVIPAMRRVDGALMDAVAPRLIQQFGVGLEGVDLGAALQRGIPTANVPAANTGNASSVAELTVLHLLALFRRYDAARAAVRAGRLGEPYGESLSGKTAVILGFGAVGREVAARLQGFEMRLVAIGRAALPSGTPIPRYLESYVPVSELRQTLATADCLIICCTLTRETLGLIDEPELSAMPKGSFLINVARGPVVRYDALRAALASGQLAGAGLDVFWQEPVDPTDPILRENVTATPHIGGVTPAAYRDIAQALAANVERLRRGEPLHDRVSG